MATHILGQSAISCLGNNLSEHLDAMHAHQHGIRPLRELLPEQREFHDLKAGWIADRSLLLSRKWAPASCLALHAAKQAIASAGLSASTLEDAAIIAGSSRGNAHLVQFPDRRPFKLMATSNSMHGEIASAVSIELGITGPWQTISSGCAASLDAIGYAKMLLDSEIVPYAIVLGVELPITPKVIQHYLDTGVLSSNEINDPYHPQTSGFCAAEAGAALILSNQADSPTPTIDGYWCNSDADSPIGMPADGRGIRRLIAKAMQAGISDIRAICPHASGTPLHAEAELSALRALFPAEHPPISIHPLKPYTGHSVGASGLLDTAILTEYLQKKALPPNLKGLSQLPPPFHLPTSSSLCDGGTVLKIAVGMGGHNSLIALSPPS